MIFLVRVSGYFTTCVHKLAPLIFGEQSLLICPTFAKDCIQKYSQLLILEHTDFSFLKRVYCDFPPFWRLKFGENYQKLPKI